MYRKKFGLFYRTKATPAPNAMNTEPISRTGTAPLDGVEAAAVPVAVAETCDSTLTRALLAELKTDSALLRAELASEANWPVAVERTLSALLTALPAWLRAD